MKKLFALALAMGSFATPAAAQQTLWQGDMFKVTINDPVACGVVQQHPGDFFRAVFRKGGLAGNPAADTFTLIAPRSAIQVEPDGGTLNGATSATLRYLYAGSGFGELTASTISGVSVLPAPVKRITQVVTIAITIHDIYKTPSGGQIGCNVTLTGKLGKRPI